MKNHFWVLLLLCLAGCMVGPNYRTPEVCVADTWDEQQADSSDPVEKWWELFEDDLLNKYICFAVQQNYDLQIAEANILKARALRQVSASKLFPHVNLDVNGT